MCDRGARLTRLGNGGGVLCAIEEHTWRVWVGCIQVTPLVVWGLAPPPPPPRGVVLGHVCVYVCASLGTYLLWLWLVVSLVYMAGSTAAVYCWHPQWCRSV